MRPRIGITTSTIDRTPHGPPSIASALNITYVRAIGAAGGIPFLLPTLAIDDAEDLLAPLDGLLLSGGGDIHPRHWGETPHAALGIIDEVRDQFEFTLTRAALRRDIPLLGICRGSQVLAVATGGSLWQDIPSQFPTTTLHRQIEARHLPTHRVHISPECPLARIFWPELPHTRELLSLDVNSHHHQAPKNCGTVFSAFATTPDGLIEGLTAPDATFAVGVQWHPEEMAETDPRQQRLFAAFITAASSRK